MYVVNRTQALCARESHRASRGHLTTAGRWRGRQRAGRAGQRKPALVSVTIARGDLAKGIDPQQKTAQVDPATAKLIPAEVLPQELQKVGWEKNRR